MILDYYSKDEINPVLAGYHNKILTFFLKNKPIEVILSDNNYITE